VTEKQDIAEKVVAKTPEKTKDVVLETPLIREEKTPPTVEKKVATKEAPKLLEKPVIINPAPNPVRRTNPPRRNVPRFISPKP
jgi:hypothetical protein